VATAAPAEDDPDANPVAAAEVALPLALALPLLDLDAPAEDEADVLPVSLALLPLALLNPVSTAPAVIVTGTNKVSTSVPLNVALSEELLGAGLVIQSVSVAVSAYAESQTPAVTAHAASAVPVILQSISPRIFQ